MPNNSDYNGLWPTIKRNSGTLNSANLNSATLNSGESNMDRYVRLNGLESDRGGASDENEYRGKHNDE